ncbi:unnamed protein product [marine sediment metagenome]|uniref:Uncharacterized protein n=1 Tax=marine sediment metagenome TaxID=412755 RepID=X1ACW8_9ZZZZ
MGCDNLIFGYSDQYKEREWVGDATEGNNVVETSDVPEGEIWVVTYIQAKNQNTGPTNRFVEIDDDGGLYRVIADYSVAAGVSSLFFGEQILAEGEHLRAVFFDCTLGDSLELHARGYKMEL